jgi:PAS domain S-box-containing protein
VSVGYAAGKGIDPSRREAEASAAAADDYALIFEALPAFIWTSSPAGGLEYCNRRLLEYSQCSITELAGDGWLALLHPDDRERTRAAWARAIETGESHEVEYRLRCASNGSYRWFLVRGEPMRDSSGAVVRWCGTATDVERIKRMEEALERNEALLRHSQRSAHVGSFLVEIPVPADRSQDRSQWSDELYRIFGYEPGTIEPGAAAAIPRIHPDDRERVAAAASESYRDKKPYELEYRVLREDGVRTVYAWGEFEPGSPLRLWGTCQDVTEQRHATTELREADRRKNEFLAILAHELRNPLAPIRQSVVIAQNSRASEEQRQRAFEIIERQVAHMARLLEDLLEASRISHGRLDLRREPTKLGTALLTAIETARPLIEARSHALTVDAPEEAIWLDADPIRLAQIFTNLLTNAAKYTDPHGRIRLHVRTDGELATISVRDNGVGIGPELLPRVFDMFSQAEPALERTQGGLGIGLALARGLVALHGGSIEARSEGLHGGSEFIVTLPILGTRSDRAEPPGSQVAEPRKDLRILVADDNPDAADSLAMTLRLLGHEVEVTYDGRQALAIAGIYHPDTALIDIGMPELNGYQLARQIRAEPWGRNVRLVAVTGWGQEEDRRRALEAGFDEHLTKPVDPAYLASLIEARPDSGR